jgi:hypothetical protein
VLLTTPPDGGPPYFERLAGALGMPWELRRVLALLLTLDPALRPSRKELQALALLLPGFLSEEVFNSLLAAERAAAGQPATYPAFVVEYCGARPQSLEQPLLLGPEPQRECRMPAAACVVPDCVVTDEAAVMLAVQSPILYAVCRSNASGRRALQNNQHLRIPSNSSTLPQSSCRRIWVVDQQHMQNGCTSSGRSLSIRLHVVRCRCH